MPLHNACSYGHYEVTQLLIEHGACVNVADLWKFTPLHEAAAKGKFEICKFLLKVSVCSLSIVSMGTRKRVSWLGSAPLKKKKKNLDKNSKYYLGQKTA